MHQGNQCPHGSDVGCNVLARSQYLMPLVLYRLGCMVQWVVDTIQYNNGLFVCGYASMWYDAQIQNWGSLYSTWYTLSYDQRFFTLAHK